jgi:hypothetical protein
MTPTRPGHDPAHEPDRVRPHGPLAPRRRLPERGRIPPDDTGNGFDNIGDVLSLSPLLLEKYLQAADTIITGVVPQSSRVTPDRRTAGTSATSTRPGVRCAEGEDGGNAERAERGPAHRVREKRRRSSTPSRRPDAKYSVDFNLAIKGPFNFDPERCRVVTVGRRRPVLRRALRVVRPQGDPVQPRRDLEGGPPRGRHRRLPLPPASCRSARRPGFEEKQRLEVHIQSVKVKGPTTSPRASCRPTTCGSSPGRAAVVAFQARPLRARDPAGLREPRVPQAGRRPTLTRLVRWPDPWTRRRAAHSRSGSRAP